MTSQQAKAPPEQLAYGNLLFYGSWIAIAILLVTYFVYAAGILEPYIPMEQLPHYWTNSASEYVHEANVPLGWGWVSLLGKGDFLNFMGIVLLAGMTIVCFLTLLPAYIRAGDIPFVVIVLLEVLVLCVGASGILGAGGH
ncbi:MAG: DUF1634 domain-containing protein [Syntrophobacteria bacterium]